MFRFAVDRHPHPSALPDAAGDAELLLRVHASRCDALQRDRRRLIEHKNPRHGADNNSQSSIALPSPDSFSLDILPILIPDEGRHRNEFDLLRFSHSLFLHLRHNPVRPGQVPGIRAELPRSAQRDRHVTGARGIPADEIANFK